MTIPILRRVALAAALLTTVAVLPGLPAYAAGTGIISGTVKTSTSTAAADVSVQIYEYDNGNTEIVGWATTDSQGHYQVTGLTAGLYVVGFQPVEGPQQFHPQTFELWGAEPKPVADGATTTINEWLSSTGVISGQIRYASGVPASDVPVIVEGSSTSLVSYTTTDADGRYRVVTAPDWLVVSFEPIAGQEYQRQFVPGMLSYETAGAYELTPAAQLTVDDTVLPIGILSGRLTTAAGSASAGALVRIEADGGTPLGLTTTNANGDFSVSLLAADYLVSFHKDAFDQYYPGRTSSDGATEVAVRGGETTRITESWLGVGSVRVTGVDAVSGAPIADFCVKSVCSNGTGKVTVAGLSGGGHRLEVWPADVLHFYTAVTVQVKADQTIDVTAKLSPAAAISARIIDRQTGTPVAGICLFLMRPKRVDIPDGIGECSDSTGRITVGRLPQDSYRLVAWPHRSGGSTRYGQQWVGAVGGVGDERQAAVVTAWAGRVAVAPEVKLDLAGTITGRVTDAAGQPAAGLGVGVLPNTPGIAHNQATTDADGRYQLTGVGPYNWPVTFEGTEHSHWSGGTGNRHAATTVKVTSGASVTYDTVFKAGVTITGTIKNQAGVPGTGGRILAHNVTTGDVVGWGSVSDGRYSLPAVTGQSVYLTWSAAFNGSMHSGQYPVAPTVRSTRPGGPTLATAGFAVPSTGPLTVNITVQTS